MIIISSVILSDSEWIPGRQSRLVCAFLNVSPAHSPPGRAVTFLDKSNQNQDSKNASFAAQAFALQISQHHRLI